MEKKKERKKNPNMARLDPESLRVRSEQMKKMVEDNKEFSQHVKKYAKARRASSPIQVELLADYARRIDEYVESQTLMGKPVTIAGTCIACGISTDTYRRCVRGDYDYIVDEYMEINDIDEPYYVDENGEVLPILEPSKLFGLVALRIQEQLETNMYSNKGNPVGSIFAAKAQYGWKEDEPKTVNQNLVIADAEKAKEIMKMLE